MSAVGRYNGEPLLADVDEDHEAQEFPITPSGGRRRFAPGGEVWSASPASRLGFHKNLSSADLLLERFTTIEEDAEADAHEVMSVSDAGGDHRPWYHAVPAILIGTMLNAMLCVPFGMTFFPSGWDMPVPRAIGIQMFLFSTIVCQLVFTATSTFRSSMGMMMVENIPFMHTLADSVLAIQGPGKGSLATIMVVFMLSTVIVGAIFMALGKLKLGDAVYYCPRYVITGCIGGIGIFVLCKGLEVSTGVPFTWTAAGLQTYGQSHNAIRWITAVVLVVIIQILIRLVPRPLLPPVYFLSITPVFHVVLAVFGLSLEAARDKGWVFEVPPNASPLLMWELLDFTEVRWDAILSTVPTLAALTVFALMHVPINIPSLCDSTKFNADMNQELIAHGWANLVSGCCGGLPNYLCYSNSLLYFKCQGGGQFESVSMAVLTSGLFFAGPMVIAYIPRCMAGCLLCHLGWCLTQEALIDSWPQYDVAEYFSVVLITLTMTFSGMTSGLALGVLLAALTFAVQSIRFSQPVRGTMQGTTLRSGLRRCTAEKDVLDEAMRGVHIMQLQGVLFFGNSSVLCTRVEDIMMQPAANVMILDFTLVSSIESSAADAIAKIYSVVAKKYNGTLVYASGRDSGFPTAFPLSTGLAAKVGKGDLHVANNLVDALEWVEEKMLRSQLGPPNCTARARPCVSPGVALPLRQLHALCPWEPQEVAQRLLQAFQRRELTAQSLVWRQGAHSDSCLLLSEGLLISELEEEAGTTESVSAGALAGEYGLLSKGKRMSTLRAAKDSVVYQLGQQQMQELQQSDPYLMYVLSRICIDYLGARCNHPMNRIWETHSLPI